MRGLNEIGPFDHAVGLEMKRPRGGDTFSEDRPTLSTQLTTPKTYTDTVIGENPGVVQGDNYGSNTNQYGNQHHYLPRREAQELNIANFPGDKFNIKKFDALLASLAFDSMGVRLWNVGPALSNTCQWLRDHEHFISWLSDSQRSESPGLPWIKCKPGSG